MSAIRAIKAAAARQDRFRLLARKLLALGSICEHKASRDCGSV
jgi:hypothetical protein